jgi:hypothetical protein
MTLFHEIAEKAGSSATLVIYIRVVTDSNLNWNTEYLSASTRNEYQESSWG